MMKVLVFLLLVAVASGARYSKCGWARILKAHQMDGHQGYSLANWVCLTEYESSFDTQKKNQNSNGSTDYGIFQINSRWWCSDGKTRSANTCGISCDVLLTNNIGVAIACAKRIPIRQWVAWSRHCSRMDLSSYLADCGL